MAVIIAGVFPSRNQAQAAVRELRDHGFQPQDVSFALHSTRRAAMTAGAISGSTMTDLNWVPNHRSTSLAEIGNTSVGGQISDCLNRVSQSQGGNPRLSNALTGMGIPQQHAEWYDQQVQQGYDLVTVCTDHRSQEAQNIMDRFGSLQVPSSQRTPRETPTASGPVSVAANAPNAQRIAPTDQASPDSTDNTPLYNQPPTTSPQQSVTGQSGVAPNDDSDQQSAQASQASTINRLAHIRQGADVYTSDGHRIGSVQASDPNCVHVLCCSNLFVPPERVRSVSHDRIVLNVARNEMANYDWATCQPTHRATYQPGGPGVSGLPPQAHQGGVEIPIENSNLNDQ